MSRRNPSRLIQVDVPPEIKRKLIVGAEKYHNGNVSEYIRKWLYRGLMQDGLMTGTELAAALAGLAASDLEVTPKAS